MKQSSVKPLPVNPYKNFRFRVKWDGKYVAGGSKISALRRVTEVIEHREGADPNLARKSPGLTRYEPITLERGVSHDPEFEQWANAVWKPGAWPGDAIPKDFRKDITIEIFNEAGKLVIAYRVYRCWVTEYQALPDLDANHDAVIIQAITLAHEGWERETAGIEPQTPSSPTSRF